jgi:flagellar hook-length control protein FliK
MIQLNMPMPAAPAQTVGEAAAAKQAAVNESSSNFKDALDDVAANSKAVAQEAVEANRERADALAKDADSKPEVASAEENNRAERADEAEESIQDKQQDREQEREHEQEQEQSPDFVAIEVELPIVQAPVEVGVGVGVGVAAGTVGAVTASQGAAGPGSMPVLALNGVDEAMQVVRGGSLTSGQSAPDAGGLPFGLRSASSSNGQSTPQVNRAPLSAQSPTFSAELAERVGSLRLISRSGISDQVRINLVPRDLGNLDIRLQVDGDSRVHMLVTAESEAVKDLLKSQITQLRDAMMKQGMEFGDVDIQVDLQQRENSAGAEAEMQWGGDGRFEFAGNSDRSDLMQGEEGVDESLIMGKVVRSADGGMSVFI